MAGVSREQLDAHPVPGKWSICEVVCHIADYEPVYADRMKRVIAENEFGGTVSFIEAAREMSKQGAS